MRTTMRKRKRVHYTEKIGLKEQDAILHKKDSVRIAYYIRKEESILRTIETINDMLVEKEELEMLRLADYCDLSDYNRARWIQLEILNAKITDLLLLS